MLNLNSFEVKGLHHSKTSKKLPRKKSKILDLEYHAHNVYTFRHLPKNEMTHFSPCHASL